MGSGPDPPPASPSDPRLEEPGRRPAGASEEERFRQVAEAALDGICIQESGTILYANAELERMLRYGPGELVGRRVQSLFAPESAAGMSEAIAARREGLLGQVLVRKDGTVFPAESRARNLEWGGRRVRVVAVRDVSERKAGEAALRASEEKFSKLFRFNPDAIVVADFESRAILDLNEGFERLLGYRRREVIGRTAVELGLWFRREDRDRLVEAVRREGVVRDQQADLRCKDGRIRTCLLSGQLIDIAGRRCYVVAAADITDRLEQERVLRRTRDEFTRRLIESQEAERRRIAAELHDSLGQELLLIANRARLAQETAASLPALGGDIRAIGELARSALDEVRRISQALRPHQLDQLGLTRSLEAMIDGAARSSGIPFERKLDPVDDLFPPEAATNLYRVVQEALNNVLKHARARRARVALERDLHEVTLLVEDDGLGLPPGPTAGAGPGLGLPNLTERVRLLGGALALDSAPSRGLRLRVAIPIAPPD